MGKLDTLITRMRYALESMEDKDQELIVDHVETYAARVNASEQTIFEQYEEGETNGQ